MCVCVHVRVCGVCILVGDGWGPWRCVKCGSHLSFPSKTELCKRRIEFLYISRRHEGIHEGVLVRFAFLHLIIMRDIHLDLLSNEWGPCREEMFNIWSCGSRQTTNLHYCYRVSYQHHLLNDCQQFQSLQFSGKVWTT